MSSQSQGTACTEESPKPTIHHHPHLLVPRGGGLWKRGLHCLASCLAAAPLREARCRPGSERVKAAGRDKGLRRGARLPRSLPQSLHGSVCLGGPGPGPEKPPTLRLQPPARSSGPTGLPQFPNSPKLKAILPCLLASPGLAKGAEAPPPRPC